MKFRKKRITKFQTFKKHFKGHIPQECPELSTSKARGHAENLSTRIRGHANIDGTRARQKFGHVGTRARGHANIEGTRARTRAFNRLLIKLA